MSSKKRQSTSTNPLLGPAAVDTARWALEELGDGDVGRHIGVGGLSPHAVTHRFAADVPGYHGWEWQAVLACAAGSDEVTVSELALVPGGEALQAPDWVPYTDRVRPGDLEPGDVMPPAPGDSRLSDDGTMSQAGWKEAAQRWLASFGPEAPMAAQAHLQCATCAFFLPLKDGFGVCANEYSADGRAVHARYGCGAHSQTTIAPEPAVDPDTVFDDEAPFY